jgi:hypothetical protein
VVDCSVYPAFKPNNPLVEQGHIALLQHTPIKVLPRPVVVPVFYTNWPDQAKSVTFLKALTGSDYWKILNQYGVGAATVHDPVIIPGPAPATISDFEISNLVAANATKWLADKNAFFVIYFPASTHIGDARAGSCKEYSGYHTATYLPDKTEVPFAVIPVCPGSPPSTVVQHEVMEGVADPIPGDGYESLPKNRDVWELITGNEAGEIGDMCEQDRLYLSGELSQYELQPIWSNDAVRLGNNPCQTNSDPAYFGAFPELPDKVTINSSNDGVVVQPGTSRTIPLRLFSNTGDIGHWKIEVAETYSYTHGGGGYHPENHPIYQLSQPSGKNGDTVNLTIVAPPAFTSKVIFQVRATYSGASPGRGYLGFSFPGVVSYAADTQ